MKAGIVGQDEAAIGRRGRGDFISVASNQHVTTEEPLERWFAVWSATRLYSGDQLEKLVGG